MKEKQTTEITEDSYLEPAKEEGMESFKESTHTPSSHWRKRLSLFGWISFAVFSLFIFTLLKLPNDRIANFIHHQVVTALAKQGITLMSKESSVSFFPLIKFSMKDVTFRSTTASNFPPAKIQKMEIWPHLLRFIVGKQGADFSITQGSGNLTGAFSLKAESFSVSFEAKKCNLGELGILPLLGGIQGSFILNGNGSFTGNSLVPSSLEGETHLQASQIILDQQMIAGFSIPKISISEAKIDLKAEKSKVNINNFTFGKPSEPGDDIRGNVKGNLLLGRTWLTSQLDVRVNFSLSSELLKSFAILEAILGAAKQPDGSYSYQLNGALSFPVPTPINPAIGQ